MLTALTRATWRYVPAKSLIRPVMRRLRSSRLAPRCWARSFRLYRILSRDYGHLHSIAVMRSVDARDAPLPWLTYPAIEYLRQLDFSDKRVFEYGSGASTLFWSGVARQIDSVEHVPDFYREVARQAPANCQIVLREWPDEYVSQIAAGAPYDVIVIDGHSRVRCAEVAPQYLKPGGLIILDNSDWFPEASARLRAADLIEVDMAGFAPINDCAHTTSFYFDRQFRAEPRHDQQPTAPIGSVPKPKFAKVVGPVADAARARE